MPDMKEALRQAGLQMSKDRRDEPRTAPGAGNPFPRDYPKYFTEDGYTNIELLKDVAKAIADKCSKDGLTRNQLRAFYDHAKRQVQRLQYGIAFREILPEIVRLKTAAADRSTRTGPNRIPPDFREFIDRNVDAISDRPSFEKGFMPHFEAVVAYFPRDRRG
jgi:CRISPR type III-A-associated protein Csm2